MSRKKEQTFAIGYEPKSHEFFLIATSPCGCETGKVKIAMRRLRAAIEEFDASREAEITRANVGKPNERIEG